MVRQQGEVMFPPPAFRPTPDGEHIPFAALCAEAGMALIVSGRLPEVRLHGEALDFKAVAPGRVAYCLGLPLLPADPALRARTMMNKLAYQFMDWAAREVVAHDGRSAAREQAASFSSASAKILRRALAPNATRILLRLRRVKAERVGDLAENLGIAQPHVSRALGSLLAAGLVSKTKRGREVIFEASQNRRS